MESVSRTLLYITSRVILGGVFVYASVGKIADPHAFALTLFNYQLLPAELVNLSAIILPWVEMLCGVLLILGVQPLPAATVLNALLIVFAVAIGYNLARGLDFHCGCFSTSPEARSAGMVTLARDLILLIPGAICLVEAYIRTVPERL
jgi:uncharacterized membrane protein YphA (DoxX/SURF4 family)